MHLLTNHLLDKKLALACAKKNPQKNKNLNAHTKPYTQLGQYIELQTSQELQHVHTRSIFMGNSMQVWLKYCPLT